MSGESGVNRVDREGKLTHTPHHITFTFFGANTTPTVKSLAVLHRDGLEEDETLYDRATRKARDWDDWKDDHTKGYGDTKKF